MQTLYDTKPLQIIFDKVDQYITKYDSNKYLALFHSDEKYEKILINYVKNQYLRCLFS